MIRLLSVICLFILSSTQFLHAREKELFNNGWLFSIDKPVQDDCSSSSFNDKDWDKVTLPHTPRLEPLVVNDQWQGICWYRKHFSISEKVTGKRIYFRFEGAMNVAEVWVNGKMMIKHIGGYLPFVIDVTDVAVIGDGNVIAVKLDNRDNLVTGPKPLAKLDFNMYGGLYRNVWLISKEPIHISDPYLANKVAGGGMFVTYPNVDWTSATINVKTHLENQTSAPTTVKLLVQLSHDNRVLRSEVIEGIYIPAAGDKEVESSISIKRPNLWSPESPYLYDIKATVVVNGEFIDEESQRIGLREFDFRDGKLFLNGYATFLRGVNRHQEYPYIGYALSDNDQYRDAMKIKEAGFDYVRLSHYPHSEAFMDACDELGLVTIDAVLGWQYFGDSLFQQHVIETARQLIRRDRNRASVLAWEVSLNESGMSKAFMDTIHKVAHEEYPGKRFYTSGWKNYAYDIFLEARQHRLGHKPFDGSKPYIVSEYGDWEYYAQNAGLNQDSWGDLQQEERSSRQLLGAGEKRLLQQAKNIQEAHNDNFNTTASADGYWAMFDYNRGYADDLESSGIMSINRLPKYAYYFFRSQRDNYAQSNLYSCGPMAYIASNWTPESSLDVTVFSNCEKAELFLNGKSLGVQLPDSSAISNNLKHPPFTFKVPQFEPGVLEVKGFVKNEVVALYKVSTPGEPKSLEVKVDKSHIPFEFGVNDHAFVYIQVVDENGTIVPVNDKEVVVKAKGCTLLNQGVVITEAGIATLLIEFGNKSEKVVIEASMEGVKTKSFNLKLK